MKEGDISPNERADPFRTGSPRNTRKIRNPDAELKVYLDASAEERARRRHAELAASGVDLPYDHVLHDLIRRDAADSSRATAPLAKACDAIVIETDGLTVNEIVDELLDLAERTARARRERGAD